MLDCASIPQDQKVLPSTRKQQKMVTGFRISFTVLLVKGPMEKNAGVSLPSIMKGRPSVQRNTATFDP
jgi:hypothetical protein